MPAELLRYLEPSDTAVSRRGPAALLSEAVRKILPSGRPSIPAVPALRRTAGFVEEYNLTKHGYLVHAEVPHDYEEKERYWILEGCSEVCIARNRQTNQDEYLLFEPVLSRFEYRSSRAAL